VEKTKVLYGKVSYPISTEIVYIKPEGHPHMLGKEFDQFGCRKFLDRFRIGTKCSVGVFVGFTSNGENFFVTSSSIDGTLVDYEGSSRPGFGWDQIFSLSEFGKTLNEIQDANLKDYISFRRLSYLKLWLNNFPGE
jgi:inosine/xanthosine triphosphate pyrophosphatase family protein